MSEVKPAAAETAFVNEMRLGWREWIWVAALVLVVVIVTPRAWTHVETFTTEPDYRVPYALSKDYWLYQRRLAALPPTATVLIGDSVIWGEYVAPEGTLSHFLNMEAGRAEAFANAGMNGLFPLALGGLVEHYGGELAHRRVVLHCNLLWMSSAKADLQTKKEERFNHARLVPQFAPRIPCYRADASERLGIVVERNLPFLAWVNHLQNTAFNQKSLPDWTLESAGGEPPALPNAYRNPLAQIPLAVPAAPNPDPERNPASTRHRAWSTNGEGTTRFEWVPLETSLQWAAFQRLTELLRARGNELFLLVGPFNEHLMAAENRPAYRALRDGVTAWLRAQKVAHYAPDALASTLYADASHPLTDGYRELAHQLWQAPEFAAFARGAKP